MKLRDYQIDVSDRAVKILREFNLVALSCEVRVGKTLMALNTCILYGSKKVLFLTKKKAIPSIMSDYNNFGYADKFDLIVMNNESLHKLEDNDFDLIVMDESHRLGSFPKPCKMAKDLKARFSSKPMILLSGTMSPESYSQFYHQMWVSMYSPWKRYTNFYKWANDYVMLKQKRIGQRLHNDYSGGLETKIMGDISHLIIKLTQEEAGFSTSIDEEVLKVKMKPVTYGLMKKLKEDLVVNGESEVILADTAAKLMQKMHQLSSGTIKFESGNSMIIDTSKADFIKERFKGKKLAIIYVFKEELNLLTQVFGEDNVTNDIDEFNSTDKHFVGQVVSSREGINLSKADCLVMYNIQHSAVSYFQARDRLTTKDRLVNKVYWIFAEDGLEEHIYKVVHQKKKYTLNIFKKDYKIK